MIGLILGIFTLVGSIVLIICISNNYKKKEQNFQKTKDEIFQQLINEKKEEITQNAREAISVTLAKIDQMNSELAHKNEMLSQVSSQLEMTKKVHSNIIKQEKENYEEQMNSFARYLYQKKSGVLNQKMNAYIIESEKVCNAREQSENFYKVQVEDAREYAKGEIEKLRAELEDFRARRRSINEEIRREELLKTEKENHILVLDQNEIEDIEQLILLSKNFHNKEVIYKLIWTTFLQKSFNNMINKLFGVNVPKGVIYCIENLSSHKKYIGKTSAEVSKRWSEHIKTSLGIGTISHQKIHEALFGNWNNFSFSVIEQVPKEKISEREKYYIDFYQSNIYGYNLKKGG